MRVETLERMLPRLREAFQRRGESVQVDRKREIPLRADAFTPIHVASPDQATRRLAFIDGGNAEIIGGVNVSLQGLRAAAIVYAQKKQLASSRQECLCLTTTVPRKNGLYFVTDLDPRFVRMPDFSIDDRSIAKGDQRPSVSLIPQIARRFLELMIARKAVAQLEAGDAVVLDGLISPRVNGEDLLVEELLTQAKQRGVVVLGLAKTSRLMTEEGAGAMDALRSIAPPGCWRYSADSSSSIRTHFVKLHERAKHLFRLEVPSFCEGELDAVLSELRQISTDPIFLGYPYGLIAVDRLARISDREKEYLAMALRSKAGASFKEIEGGLRALDAHDILDNV